MLGFSHDGDQRTAQTLVGLGEERDSGTCGTGSTGSTNSVNVVLNVTWHIIIDNVVDTLDVCNGELVKDPTIITTRSYHKMIKLRKQGWLKYEYFDIKKIHISFQLSTVHFLYNCFPYDKTIPCKITACQSS